MENKYTQRSVPLLDLKPQWESIKEELTAAVMRVCESQRFILGPEVEQLESEIGPYCGARYALGVSSGTDALLMALMALEVGPGDEVVTTPYSFFATAGSIVRLGAKPVFVDIDPITFNIDVEQIERKINRRTKALLPVHLFGQSADMQAIKKIAAKYELPIIEDACQAIGAEYLGKRAGSLGTIGCFSFFPSKNLGAFGDGGLVTTDDQAIFEKLKSLRMHGSTHQYFHDYVGGNFRLDALQAAVLRVKLRYLESWTEARRRNAVLYGGLFLEAGLPFTLPAELPGRRHVYNQYVVRVPDGVDRDSMLEFCKSQGIGVNVYYPLALHQQHCFAAFGGKAGDFPESERAALQTIALPVFPELTASQLQTVVEVLSEGLR